MLSKKCFHIFLVTKKKRDGAGAGAEVRDPLFRNTDWQEKLIKYSMCHWSWRS